ncbi:hypothetical protein NOR_08620 [Metarhizium rileyi]|uniref:DUF7924 domain-containing protein n=1 Tax=Metarhizium rileyi (strain RCEF 4871) TaxID=1649241 RepID=A0A166W089_METRR|nr:hypothetical protein NOR_08620 [Metarhizium rileyi RCEF 4871]
MARTRARSAARRGGALSSTKSQGQRPQGIQKGRYSRQVATLRQLTPKRIDESQAHPSHTTKKVDTILSQVKKRPLDDLEQVPDPSHKRLRPSPRLSRVKDTLRGSPSHSEANKTIDPIEYWTTEGCWPTEYFEPKMEHFLTRKKSMSSLSRKRSSSGTSVTPSDQKPREEKSTPYRHQRYEIELVSKGSFMDESDLGITKESQAMYLKMLSTEQKPPNDSLFQDKLFKQTCRSVKNRNEARVMQDLTPLIVPSAELLCIQGAEHLKVLVKCVNEGWNSSIPITRIRPQPDYALGFKREAFSDDQLAKLAPFLGDFLHGDQSYFMATYSMYFPFLTCEVKCGAAALDVADRQNAHSMTLSVRGIVELLRAVKRENEVHQQILSFSISHDHRLVRIYGHYPIINGKDTKYYRYPIRTFDFTEQGGKERWTAYRFTRKPI